MSEDDFLARWSRRKQAARDGHAEPRPEQPAEANAPAAAVSPSVAMSTVAVQRVNRPRRYRRIVIPR